ncbi:MAG: hypothetical protein ACKVE3_02815 [Dissulfuribacterales bacterium]
MPEWHVTIQEMGETAPDVGLQGQTSNHRKLRRLRAGVVSVEEKVPQDGIRYGPWRRTRVNR